MRILRHSVAVLALASLFTASGCCWHPCWWRGGGCPSSCCYGDVGGGRLAGPSCSSCSSFYPPSTPVLPAAGTPITALGPIHTAPPLAQALPAKTAPLK